MAMAASVETAAGPVLAEQVSRGPAEPAEAALAGLAERQARLMFRVAMAVLRRAEDAEDAVQEAFLRMLRGGGGWQGAREERAYVARVVWRVAVDRAAAKGGRAERSLVGEDGAEMELLAGGSSAEQQMAEAGERGQLRRLIDALPEDLRQPLVLCAIEEVTSREVAEAMGLPEGTVRRRVMRAREELRKRWLAMEGGRR